MKRKAVESSNIASVGYKKTEKVLEIRFNGGGIYQYVDVPEHVYMNMMTAESKGQYFHSNIRNSYTFTKVK